MITKKEFKYIVYATIFSFLVFGLIIPYMIDSGAINRISPLVQFLIFNVTLFIFLQLFLSGILQGTKIKIVKAIGLLSLFTALDVLSPPFSIGTNGIISSNLTLGGSASDFAIGTLFHSLNFSGFAVYFLTYVIAPFVLLLIAALILKDISKNLPG